jgi:hypothetical protein
MPARTPSVDPAEPEQPGGGGAGTGAVVQRQVPDQHAGAGDDLGHGGRQWRRCCGRGGRRERRRGGARRRAAAPSGGGGGSGGSGPLGSHGCPARGQGAARPRRWQEEARRLEARSGQPDRQGRVDEPGAVFEKGEAGAGDPQRLAAGQGRRPGQGVGDGGRAGWQVVGALGCLRGLGRAARRLSLFDQARPHRAPTSSGEGARARLLRQRVARQVARRGGGAQGDAPPGSCGAAGSGAGQASEGTVKTAAGQLPWGRHA